MLNHNSHKKNHGFTLLEVLVAISIFALMSMAAYQILQGVMRSGEISKRHSEELVAIQRAMLIIEKDFTQVVARASRTEGDDRANVRVLNTGKSFFDSEDEGIEFTRLGWSNPLNLLPRSNLVRVRYRLVEGQLQRQYFLYPDIVARQEPETQVLLDNIETLSFRFWNKGWKTTWTDSKTLPEGIEISFTSKKLGKFNRMFLVSQSGVSE